jgi:hypothetical protein
MKEAWGGCAYCGVVDRPLAHPADMSDIDDVDASG